MKGGRVWAAALAAVMAWSVAGRAAESVFDPAKAGPEFKLQGEFTGQIDTGQGAVPAGGQVAIYYNNGQPEPRLTMLSGGLPGAGYDNLTKVELVGRIEGDKALFDGQYQGTGFSVVDNGQALIIQAMGQVVATLNRVERKSPTLGAVAPAGAVVLFDGTNLDAWNGGTLTDYNGEKVLNVEPKQPVSKQGFKDFTLHLEFLQPYEPKERGQGRANSGVYLQDRYEVQIVDSFGVLVGPGKPDGNVCGDIYSKSGAATNAILPPLTWQTYDIDFRAPRYQGGQKVENAKVTIRLNGVLIHDNVDISGPTGGNGHGEADEAAPLMLQHHEHPIYFRNIWMVDKK